MKFKDFKKDKNKTEIKIEDDKKKILKNYLNESTILSDNGLVNLVMLVMGESIDENFINELDGFEYINESKITKKGQNFLNENDTIDRLKTLSM